MRTVAQVAKVAELTGGIHLEGVTSMSARVDVGDDFETHRSSVESVSVLFKLFGREGDDLVAVPSGWSVTGARFEVCWPR